MNNCKHIYKYTFSSIIDANDIYIINLNLGYLKVVGKEVQVGDKRSIYECKRCGHRIVMQSL